MTQISRIILPAYLGLVLLLGGASAAGHWANLILQIAGLLIITAALVIRAPAPMPHSGRRLIALVFTIMAVIGLQLVPLPPSVWSSLAGRDGVARGFELLEQPLPWMPLSLSPYGTISSALWLIPAVAALLAGLRLSAFRRSWIAWIIVAITLLSVAVGALQLVGGRASASYFYDITNYGVAVGFFSNANHMGIMLVASIPFVAALYMNEREKGRSVQQAAGLKTILAGVLLVIAVGVALNGSLAALGLSVPAALASGLMVLRHNRRTLPIWLVGIAGLLLIGSLTAVFASPLGNNLTSEEAKASEESRYTSFKRTLDAAGDFFPVGSGIGTFQQVYPAYEDAGTINRTYMNHAHSDYIELFLETGLPGTTVIVLFLIWWISRTSRLWSAEEQNGFALAATIASGALLAHSLVDYPLRTAALSTILAVCCVLMAEPRQKNQARRSPQLRKARHLEAT